MIERVAAPSESRPALMSGASDARSWPTIFLTAADTISRAQAFLSTFLAAAVACGVSHTHKRFPTHLKRPGFPFPCPTCGLK
jgi:hypothetical protein